MKQKIRVMHVVESLGVGGMENGVINLANFFDNSTFQFSICCFSEKGVLAKRILNSQVQVHALNYGPGIHPESVFHLARVFRDNAVDIVHTHGWGARSLVAFLGARLAKAPFCINGEHGVLHVSKKSQYLMQRVLFSLFDGNLSVSEGLKSKLIEKFKLRPDDVTVIPNGVRTDIFHGSYNIEQIQTDLKIKPEDFIVGITGSLKHQKNQKVAVRAVSRLAAQGIPVKLLLVGDGPDREFLQDLAEKLGIIQNVLFLGQRDDVPRLLSIMDALVLASIPDHEGMSNVILEAMASKVAVISSESVGSKELIRPGETGLLFQYNRPEDLAERLIYLQRAADHRNTIVGNAYQQVLGGYSLNVMIERYQNYYMKLMNGKVWH